MHLSSAFNEDRIRSHHIHLLKMNKQDTTSIMRLNPNNPSDANCSTQCSQSRDACVAPISIHHSNQKSTKLNSNNLLTSYLKALFTAIAISLFFLMVSILTIIIHILVAGPALHRRRHRRTTTTRLPNNLEEEEENLDYVYGVGFGGLSLSDLRKLASFKYSKAGIQPCSIQDCIVCLEDFKEEELCRMLPKCKHVFHANCVDTWLIRVPACPICRQEVVGSKIDGLIPIRSNEAS